MSTLSWKDQIKRDAAIAATVGVHLNTVVDVRRRFAAALAPRACARAEQKRRKARKLLMAGPRRTWSPWCARVRPRGARLGAMHLLAGRLDRGAGGGLGHRRDRAPDAQKNALKPWLKKGWCIPPKANAEFVAAMEDVLEVYQRPYDAARPQVCLDEAAKQLLGRGA